MQRSVDYDAVAPKYNRRYEDNDYPGTSHVLRQHVADRAGLDVLEVGCGTGHWLAVLSEHGARVAGLDSSAGMLEHARQRVPDARLELGSAESLPWADGSFDRVVCVNALHHFADKWAFVREAWRVLRAQGRLLVIGLEMQEVNRWCIYDYFEGTRARDEQRFAAADEIRQWMADCGFSSCWSREAERLSMRSPAREALETGQLDPSVTSQLSLLSAEEYARGIARIRKALEHADARGETLWLDADLSLYATLGVRPA
jgi:ubiquinone/menaquinone biosynthesis C-methylase UbiE